MENQNAWSCSNLKVMISRFVPNDPNNANPMQMDASTPRHTRHLDLISLCYLFVCQITRDIATLY